MSMEEKRFALLIDSDNISAKYIPNIISEMTKYGTLTYKRIYGDWTSSQTSKWKKQLMENSITPIQQFSNTFGKNATDSALIIDGMDILYTGSVDGFCIVSSDSDFTRLASRLRESGMEVIGMGEEKTPRSFRAACTVFTNLEILIDQDEEEEEELHSDAEQDISLHPSAEQDKKADSDTKDYQSGPSREQIVEDIISIITENENKGKDTGLGEIGSRLLKKHSDFDVRNYGYSSLSKFLEETDSLTLIKENNSIQVEISDNMIEKAVLDEFAINQVRDAKRSGVELSALGSRLHDEFKDFRVKDYGYATFAKFVQGINGLEIRENRMKKKIVHLTAKK